MNDGAISQGSVTLNGVEYAYLTAGAAMSGAGDSRPLAICVHGFPDVAWGWESTLHALDAAGYRAVAPFMRGYAPTAVPADGSSSIGAWVQDINALHDALQGGGDAVLIGHDWGAMTTYGAAVAQADRWSKVVTASVPPTSVMATRLMQYDQLKMFWYQYVFLQPTAEMIVANDDLEFIARLWSDWSPGFDDPAAVAKVKDALRGPGNLTAALSTYRTMYGVQEVPAAFAATQFASLSPHTQPTLYLHGETDGCVNADILDEVRAVLPPGSRAELVSGAGHFLQYEQPEVVNKLIVEFVAA